MKQYLSDVEQTRLTDLLAQFPLLKQVEAALQEQGGRLYLVGGAVRNIILGLPVTDVDVELYGVTSDQTLTLLRRFGYVELVGKSFGVFKIAGVAIDWALPRLDQAGRKPEVTIVYDLPLEQALRRRDVTMNAMALDISTYELVDPFGGREDIAKKVLRTADPAFFVQDPLRFYRVMQFIGRFSMQPDAQLEQVCREIDLHGLSHERIVSEFEKLLLLSPAPSHGIRWLEAVGRLQEIVPEVAALRHVMQEPSWHPEGDVFEHTMQAVDAAAEQSYPDAETRRSVIYAALCHDLGKVTTTNLIEGRMRSIGHDQAGVAPTLQLMQRITIEHHLQKVVALLVRHHMAPGQLVTQGSKAPAYKRLAVHLAPATNLQTLALLAYADKRGRNPQSSRPLAGALPEIDTFIQRAKVYGVLVQPEPPVLRGDDLRDIAPPGPLWGQLLKHAYELQIEQGITDKEELLRRIRE